MCTIGPATWDREKLFKLADEGMNVARLNMSHGDHASHKKVLAAAARPQHTPLVTRLLGEVEASLQICGQGQTYALGTC